MKLFTPLLVAGIEAGTGWVADDRGGYLWSPANKDGHLSFHDAIADCKARGGRLAEIYDASYNNLVSGMWNTGTHDTWISAEKDSDGTWKTVGGQPLAYSNWDYGGSNNCGYTNFAYPSGHGRWAKNEVCTKQINYVCQRATGWVADDRGGYLWSPATRDGHLSFQDAIADCKTKGGRLAEIYDASYNKLVSDMWNTGTHDTWISAEKDSDGTWKTVGGEPLGYSNWHYGGSNNCGYTNFAYPGGHGKWATNEVCTKQINYVCQLGMSRG